jgi:triosephosphate isomerase
MIIINFKTYPQATGEKAVELARICYEAAEETGVRIVVALQTADIFRVASQIKIPIFAQHVDAVEPGRNTGMLTALSLKKAGASGIFLNHSEHHYFDFSMLEEAIRFAKNEDLEVLVFCKNVEIAKKIDVFKPNYIALEEPDMVGGDTSMISLPKYHSIIRNFIESIESTPLIGAGVKIREDVFNGLKIGIKGVVLASGFVKAKDPKKVLLSLTSAF